MVQNNNDNNPKYNLEDSTNKKIGRKLKERRKFLNLTQKKLAEKIGCTFQQIQKYEAGINNISLPVLLKLCEVLKCNPHYFFSNFHFSDSQPINNNYLNDYNIKTNLLLDDMELQLVLKFRQLPNDQIKLTIVTLLRNIMDLVH